MTPIAQLIRQARAIPVIVIDDVEDSLPLARALQAGGLSSMEITLRTAAGLQAVARLRGEVEGLSVGVGTVLSVEDLKRAHAAGADFAVSPGFAEDLVKCALDLDLPYLPGAATPGEVTRGRMLGLDAFKFFPAATLGGPATLKAWGDVFPDNHFCPTGGVSPDNAGDYLALPHVAAVGSSMPAPRKMVQERKWEEIRALSHQFVASTHLK
ncbi:bifunctional 4-hydroxy-2-oxoglutarate aldolase/2-dehydro-3-deoxy-phosphogluconate aldolase [Dongia sp.]|uniref:bifunctional 4-hydroxy-2-oxoglutarate aldolase/2-dehydro-3-deoxy-phosphogluconate aldolase n=1 Tax=Dongia sp. TaxID=1977262 RepID=UPI0035B44518